MSARVSERAQAVERVMRLAPVIAVVVIEDRAHAVPLARALCAGGVRAIEVTLRTGAALAAIQAIAAEVPEAVVGAGTLVSPADFVAALKAGAQFGVSPGATRMLLDAADDIELPYLPGAATATESMALLERGYRFQKFFPATAAGGPALLKSLAGPLPQIAFCPTGGITPATARDWLALSNVLCVGGSWLTPKDKLAAGDWAGLEALAREAVASR
jgi:2-dehydro-3-deoxyphosphogluconate aldolase/(4S)-4-hydroxy-2-oxoglutarate aldolase